MNLDVFLRLATPDSSDKNPIPFGGTSVGGSRAARSELHGPSVATLPRYSALRLFTHTQLCRALLRERHDDASASASASANTTSSRSVGRDWCCRRGTEMQHCRSSRRSAMRSTMRSTCHVTSAFHCQPVSRRTGRGRRPPSLSSYSVVRARLLSPISSKSAAGTMLRPNEKVFSAYTEANTGSVLSRAIPSGGEERERERERPHSLAGSLGSPPHAHHSAEKPPPPPNHRFLQQVASQVTPVQRRRPSPHCPVRAPPLPFPPSPFLPERNEPKKVPEPSRGELVRERRKGGACARAIRRQRERGRSEVSRSSPPSPTTTNHHLRTTPVRAGPPGPRGRCISMTCDALPNGQGYCRWGRAPTSHLGDGEQKGGSDDVRR